MNAATPQRRNAATPQRRNAATPQRRKVVSRAFIVFISLSCCASLQGCHRSVERSEVQLPVAHTQQSVVEIPRIYVEDSESLSHSFKVTNSSEAHLKIVNVRPSCGCTNAALTLKELHPGQSADLTLSVDLRGRNGPQFFRCVVETDRLGEFQYGLSTFVARRAWIQPSHFHLGFVGVNTELRREGNFTLVIPRGDDPDAVKETIRFGSTSPSQVSVQSSPHVDRQFGETGDLQLRQDFEIRLQAASNPGFGECELTVSYMLNGESKQVTVPIDWHVQGDISATPRILLFRLRPSELNVDEFSKTLVVKSRSGMPFSITRTLSPSSAMTVSIQSPTDRPEHDITLNLDPAGVESERRYFEVSFEVSNSSEILRVPVAIIRTPRV